MIPQTIIDQVLSQTDIVQIVSEFVPLKKAGANFKGCCPFHNEKTPSFVVSPQKQIYHCFGCGVGGNVIGFLMAQDHMEFPVAVEWLADRLNIKIPKQNAQADRNESQNEKLLRINSYAQWFFENELKTSKSTLAYIGKRGISEETRKKFLLGFAPDNFESLTNFLRSKKIPTEFALSLGLIRKRDQANSYYDFYRNRLVFPIRNQKGQFIGFGGRTLAADEPAKYINSPESPLYNKSRELYGLFEARKQISQKDRVLIVEGYIDVLACHQLELDYAVAPLGTSLTEDQIKILKRYSENFYLMFDGDSAGKKAAIRATELCFAAKLHPKIIILPQNEDPGSFLEHRSSAKSLNQHVESSPFAMEWIFSEVIQQANSSPQNRSNLLNYLKKWLNMLPNAIERYEYLKKAANFFEIPLAKIDNNLEITNGSDSLTDSVSEQLDLEESLVYELFQSPQKFSHIDLAALSEQFVNPKIGELTRFAINYLKNHETLNPTSAIAEVPDSLKGLMRKILITGDEAGISLDTDECVGKIKRNFTKYQLKQITAQIYKAETTQNSELKMKLLLEKQKLLNQ